MQLFNLFKKKPEKKYISFNEEVEDVIVTFRLRNLKSVRKTFKGGYEELKRFMKDWRQDGSACFDEYIIRFDDLFIGEIEVVYHDTNKVVKRFIFFKKRSVYGKGIYYRD